MNLILWYFNHFSDQKKEPEDLAKVIQSQTARVDYAVVDVRKQEEIDADGKIISSINIELSRFDGEQQEIRKQLETIPKLYFHCGMSKHRGPNAARKYHEFGNGSQEIYVLEGGFVKFNETEPGLVKRE